jgi:3-oxoadipate enol-lactonase
MPRRRRLVEPPLLRRVLTGYRSCVAEATSGGTQIYYEESGRGETIVLLPGLGMATPVWQGLRSRLQGRFRILAVDPRGAGRSDKPDKPYDGETVAGDVAAVLDAVGVGRAHVVGHSMGGMIAQETAIRMPERVASLVLVATYAVADEWTRRVLEARRDIIHGMGLEEQFRLAIHFVFSPKAFRTSRDFIAGLERRVAESPPDERGYLRQLDFCLDHDASDRVGAVSVPTLVISGEDDFLTSRFVGRELAGLIPGARYEEMAEASHGLLWEEPGRFADLVADFVASGARGL